MSLISVLSGAVLSALFFGGVTPTPSFSVGAGSAPPGTASVSYTVYDEDVFFDDILEQGGVATEDFDPADGTLTGWSTGDIELWCPPPDCDDVTGAGGSSGESSAEVKVVWTFRDSAGHVLGTLQSGIKPADCDC